MYHPSFNIGIEEEFQFIDPSSRELLGYLSQSMSRAQMQLRSRDPEFEFAQYVDEAVLEAGTPVCADIKEAREQLLRIRTELLTLAEKHNLILMASGTHPFSDWESRAEPIPRYRALVEDAQMIARRLLAFGLRIHIGIENRELAVDVMNTMCYFLPHILCLANSSPFWCGRNTGLKSYRTVLLDALPRTGIPGRFNGYHDYRSYVDTLIRTNSIPNAGRIWYDIMPHHRFPTLVVRICDMLPNMRDTLAITALIQATVAWMVDLRSNNMSFRNYDRMLIAENKWLALRYGLEGSLVDFGIEQLLPVKDLLKELLERVEYLTYRLNIEDELSHIYTMIARGTCADQQLAIWAKAKRESATHEHATTVGGGQESSRSEVDSEEIFAVIDFLVKETEAIS